jgi:putative membrane protein
MESILWGKPFANKTFGVTQAESQTNRLFAFNQGFYNLFLSIAIVLGLILKKINTESTGTILIDYAVASVFAAGIVLVCSSPRLLKAALVQIIPAAAYFLFRLLA